MRKPLRFWKPQVRPGERLIASTEEAAADKLAFTVQKLDTAFLFIFLWLFTSDTEQIKALAENKLSSHGTSMSNLEQ